MKEMQGRNLPFPDRLHKFLPKGLILLSFLAISFYLGGIFCSDKGSLALNGANDVNGQICIPQPTITKFEQCNITMQDYTPCTDPTRWSKFDKRRMAFRERHCPPPSERVHCTIPPPAGYKPPIKWPRSRDECWYSNVPYDWINTQKANQRWMVKKGEKFIFPGGGTMFPKGVNGYLDQMEEVIPGMKDGTVRTALDTGCGVASWGGNLLDRGILTMSLAPRDNHEAQVEFALERGIPAMIGIIATQRLPYPASAFDMAHCSRCLIPWTDSDGISLLEVDRVLRPGGFWVLSGPPVNYEKHWTGWDTTAEAERSKLEALQELLSRMCYSLYKMEGDIAVWQKPLNNSCYEEREEEIIPMCDDSQEADDSWYVPMRPCIVKQKQNFKLLGVGQTPKWPERLTKPPERVHLLPGGSSGVFKKDTSLWEDRVKHYKSVLPQLGSNTVRNVMDMNTQYGGFAAALINDPVWVMNVVSSYAANSLGVIFDRGLIGTTHDWCEAFSTYPRTYDFLHLDGLFTTESHRCEMKLVLLEMDRILRPTGYVMMRDTPSFLDIASSLGKAMHWQCKKHPTENPNNENEALLICQKELWQSSSGANTVKEEDD